MQTPPDIALLGFGEAAQAFAGKAWRARVYDRMTDDAATQAVKRADYAAAGVTGCDTNAEAVAGAGLVMSLVTADQALAVAQVAAETIASGSIYCDLNSVSPRTKQAAARVIETAGAAYVDVAVMSPVLPGRCAAPLLLSGARADDAADALGALGFTDIRVVGTMVGRASSIKMIRSVMVKGIEALSAECVVAAQAAGVLDEVVASLDASWPGADWALRADYNLDRMMVHGLRRAAEMHEVVATLDDLGSGSIMSRATQQRQQAIGALGITSPPTGLGAKISVVSQQRAQAT